VSNGIKIQEIQKSDRVINNRNNSEEQLIKKLIAGEEHAYRELIDNYREPVLRMCRGFTRSAEDAEDLAQDVFLEVFRSIDRFKARSSLSTWIYRITVNKSLNFVRDRKNRVYDNSSQVTDIENRGSIDYSAYKQLTQKELAKVLHKALDNLPAAQRTAFVLSKYEDMKYSEIAEVMKTSVSAVESLLFRAKKNLQKRLHDYYEKNLK